VKQTLARVTDENETILWVELTVLEEVLKLLVRHACTSATSEQQQEGRLTTEERRRSTRVGEDGEECAVEH